MLLALPARAQLQVGELSTHLSGTIAPGYSADFSNMTGSDHSYIMAGADNRTAFFNGLPAAPGR